ncbi:unnamed protein product [Ceutorhynchus assimilis]|uniref:CWH43-like N-terminal domain-containing protein n=1 Tax=Ceutorhynchus assimilis TaxID=467358 RepID=A0A9N9QGD2_9CUCU|nr:unnamed protein product [Ceutorhynchus assimilis]
MPFKYSYLLPIFQGIHYVLTFTATYTLAAFVNKDIPSFFPYVSDTGARFIQSCIFSFGLGLGSLIMFLIFYLRYIQVKFILQENKEFPMKLRKLNKISVYTSAISTLHVFGVGCFQVYPYLYTHLYFAGMAFHFGLLSMASQTYIAFKIYPIFGNKILNLIRLVLLIILCLALASTGIFGLLSFLIFFKGDDVTQWTRLSGGFELHLISTFSEWILIMGTVLFLTLYAFEFKSFDLYEPKIEMTVDKTVVDI